jgi:hypothetical protein
LRRSADMGGRLVEAAHPASRALENASMSRPQDS